MAIKQRVEQMELCMDNVVEYVTQLEQLLSQFEQHHEQFLQFRQYYGSTQWYDDREYPLTIKRGVLSEDLPYEAIIQYREMAIDMLEKATKILKTY